MAGKAEFVSAIAEKTEVSKRQAEDAYEAFVSTITDSLKKGERVSLPGFGNFTVRARAAREGRNPATGAKIKIAASNNVGFKAGKELKESLNKKRKK